jgi:5-methylcytosine-specific restriction endonuclease McrA
LYGLRADCKKCHNKRTLVTSTAWNKVHPERIKVSQKRYKEKNLEKVATVKRKWQQANRKKGIEADSRYRKAHPDKKLVIQHRYYARKRGLPDTLTVEQWIACLEYFNYRCAVCGNQMRDLFETIKPHQDHWIPLASPECLGTTADNMICLCSSCNLSKGAKLPAIWLTERYGKRKATEILQRIEQYFEWVRSQNE